MNILSIDLDIIMGPDINLYNDLICNNNEITIKDLIINHSLLNGVSADLEHYKKIVLYLFEQIPFIEPENIRFSFCHEDIKYMLQNEKNVSIFNIDHHHDLGYSDQEEDLCTAANWVQYFLKNNTIEHYTWIKNSNSSTTYKLPFDLIKDKFNTINLNNIVNLNQYLPKIDKIFICLSPEWVPQKFHSLFYLIVEFFNKNYSTNFPIY